MGYIVPPPPPQTGVIPGRPGQSFDDTPLWIKAIARWWVHPWHRWQTVKDTGLHWYQVCRDCGERRIERVGQGGHQPRDLEWLKTGKFRDWSKVQTKGIRSGAQPATLVLHHRAIVNDVDCGEIGQTEIALTQPEEGTWPDLYGDEAI